MSDRKMPRSSLVAVLRQSLLRHASIGSVSSIQLTPQMLGADAPAEFTFQRRQLSRPGFLTLSFFFFLEGFYR